MPSPKEKPKKAKAKKGRGKNVPRSQPAISAKQAAKLMKDKYVRQLDQRQSDTVSTEVQAVDQVEGAGTWAVDEVIFHERPRSPRQRGGKIKERPQTTPESTEQPAPAASTGRTADRPPPKGPTSKTEYAPPPSEGTSIPRQDQAGIGDLPRETAANTAPKGTRPLRTKPAAVHGQERKIIPRQKQAEGIGTLPKETSSKTVQAGGRPLRTKPAITHDRERKVGPRQKHTINPRQNAALPSGTKPVRGDRTIQPPQIRPAEQFKASDSTTAISSQKAVQIKERSAPKIREKGEQAAAPSIKQRSASPSESIVSIESIHPSEQRAVLPKERPIVRSAAPTPNQRIERQTSYPKASVAKTPPQRPPAARQPIAKIRPSTSHASYSTPSIRKDSPQAPQNSHRGQGLSGQRKKLTPQQTVRGTEVPRTSREQQLFRTPGNTKGASPKTRGAVYQKGLSLPKPSRTLSKTTVPKVSRAVRQPVQRRMTQRAVQQLKKTIKTPAAVIKKTAAVAAKAAAALINAASALVGGGILLLAMVVIVIVAAVANSPFGLFFAQEPNAPGTVSVAQAVGTVNMAYNGRLELLQAGDYDDIIVQGQAADWTEVLAVFAVKTAGADVGGLDVATLDAGRVDKLTAVFWDMTAISVSEEIIDHPASESTEAWTEKILHITITPQTADAMRTVYAFSAYQNSALDELLSDRPALSSLAGSLTITSADIRDVLAALPADLEQARQDTVQTALQLVGKVNYFWGGKSRVIGWDSRWGQLKKVTAAGNSTSGTYRPFGLDCSGFVDWTFNNSLGYIIGHGGGARAQHTYCTNISQSAAQPGDLAFYPDDSHVGIIVGRNAAGKLLVCHCSSGSNNVVVTEFSASGFTAVGRPDIFSSS